MIFAYVIAAVCAALLWWFWRRRKRNPFEGNGKLPYSRRPLMTDSEMDAYALLLDALPDYMVFPQVQVSRVLEVPKNKETYYWFNFISRLSYDFVICRTDGTPLAAIEIDDASHELPERQEADHRKSRALRALARLLRENAVALQEANARDLARASELSAPMRDRLKLTPAIIETAAQGCEQLAGMPDVIGEITGLRQQPSGIRVGQMRVPLGVFGMIYESRPNVTIEAAALSIKSGNACILRGGSEALASCQALAALCAQALEESGLPAHGVQLVTPLSPNLPNKPA